MNKRQKIIVSITGIFLVLLILIGLTYAYFLTRIEGNTNTKSISVTTADLKLVYADASPNIEVENIQPGETVYTKSFTVTNEGNAKVTNYQVYLENVVNELNRTPDLVYTLTCETNDTDNSPCTNEIEDETAYPSVNGTLVQNSIDIEDTHTYTFTLKYKETGTDQSEDMGKSIGGKFNIYDQNDLTTLTLGHYIMNDTRVAKNGEIQLPVNIGETNEVGMYMMEDDYGESWFFRGTSSYNYVKFAGLNWRVIRINGDGSIRIILDDWIKNDDGSILKTLFYQENEDNGEDNAYIGYMYGTPGSDNYDDTHKNTNSSRAKEFVDNWYVTYIENETNNIHYQKYLADTLFCGDKTIASAEANDQEGLENPVGYSNNDTVYSFYDRFYLTSHLTTNPELKCANVDTSSYSENAGIYSRYTSKIDMSTETNLGVKVNNDLDYPIGLISADELALAGGCSINTNGSIHFNNRTLTLTPIWYIASPTYIAGYPYIDDWDGAQGLRPVINLKADNLVSTGDGTINGPYEIKEIS